MENKNIKLGEYRHFKNKEKSYQVLGIARHTETGEDMVVYKKLYDDYSMFVRPYSMFIEEVEVDGKKVKRFEYVG
ncbi:MAG: DUF1653 domain-containing protein [bacterium]